MCEQRKLLAYSEVISLASPSGNVSTRFEGISDIHSREAVEKQALFKCLSVFFLFQDCLMILAAPLS